MLNVSALKTHLPPWAESFAAPLLNEAALHYTERDDRERRYQPRAIAKVVLSCHPQLAASKRIPLYTELVGVLRP